MLDKNNSLKLLNYINTKMSRESIMILYAANNITYERCELYNDYIQSLISLIFDTYMGDEITNSQEQKNHFKWCWTQNVENFKKEGININGDKLYKYFFDFILEVYYPSSNKNTNPLVHSNILRLWNYIFDYNNIKSKSDIDTLLEVYKLFEISINLE